MPKRHEHWKDKGLKEWIFVYNCRRGLPPDIPGTLKAQATKYPALKLRHLSADALWEMARGLSIQQRSEILGAPVGYEHLFLLPSNISGDTVDAIRKGHFVVVHDVMSPINLQSAIAALKPAKPLGPPLHIRPVVASCDGVAENWSEAALHQRVIISDALIKSRDLLPRFAVFSLAPIPLAIHLGFLFSDRVEVKAFQFDRDRKVWSWPEEKGDTTLAGLETSGLPSSTTQEKCEVALRLSLSAHVSESDARASAPSASVQIEIAAAAPSVTWLRRDAQLLALVSAVRATMTAIRTHLPRCKRIHIFAAIPTPAAIVFGQCVNPRMDPPVWLYEYSHQRDPRYRFALSLEEENR